MLSVPARADGSPGRLGKGLRRALAAALTRANEDESVRAIVITGSRALVFPGAPPVKDWLRADAAPELGVLFRQIEDSPKPVVAALRGEVDGTGFELALAARARLAVAGTRLQIGDDLRMGLVPGAGGTQRLPRLVGAGPALDLLLSGARDRGRVGPVCCGACSGGSSASNCGRRGGPALRATCVPEEPVADYAAPGLADPIGYQQRSGADGARHDWAWPRPELAALLPLCRGSSDPAAG